MLRSIDGIDDIALSTNGVRLPELAPLYRDAGLDRVNISADSLRPERIAAISRRDLDFDPIAAAIAAESAGLSPVKLNVVVMRGINDDEIEDFARLTMEHPWHVRFIELMPVGGCASSRGSMSCRRTRFSPGLPRLETRAGARAGAGKWAGDVLQARGRERESSV